MNSESPRLCPAIEQRLNQLPKKSGGVLRGLWSLQHLDNESLEAILDAGDLANDTSRLSAFATSYTFLKAQKIPVRDVIMMSKAQNRRINLWWAPKRWQDQHSRLSRYETLKRLHQQNITYDMSAFEKHLPKQFKGYCIKTSQRLGMEGLRQRHCVASREYGIQDGRFAICVVFVHRRRWTVELTLTGQDDAPLCITEIKTRFNHLPNTRVRQAIYKTLGITQKTTTGVDVDNARLWKTNLRRVLPVCERLGVTKILATFDDGGDSGCINGVELYCGDDDSCSENELDKELVTIIATERTLSEGRQWIERNEEAQTTLGNALTDLIYDYLGETGVNWYNDEGGSGEFVVDLTQGILSAHIDCYYQKSECEHSNELYLEEING